MSFEIESPERRRVLLAGLGLAGLAITGAVPGRSAETSSTGWQPDPKLQADLERRKVSWLYREEGVPSYTLPDPLLCADGARVKNRREWERKRRPETLELFREHVYGRSPGKPADVRFEVLETDPQALEGKATRKRVKITTTDAGKAFAFETSLLVPNIRKGRVPAFILINNRGVSSADPTRQQKDGFWPAEEIIARGYATAVFRTNDVDPDSKDETLRPKGVRGVWPAGSGTPGEDAWATLGAWAWAASRVLDYLLTEPAINGKRVAVIGHSRGGKTALWAGAQDERFALVISNDSGCGGAALSRRKFGETVAVINRSFPYWFNGNFKKYNSREAELPIDQHQLMALIAPRALYVASADADLWADPRGEFLSLAHASPVFGLYRNPPVKPDEMPPLDAPLVRGRVGYHVRRGIHNLTPYDWEQYMNFADRLWR